MTPPPIPVTTTWHPGGAFGTVIPPDSEYLVVWNDDHGLNANANVVRNQEFLAKAVGSTWADVAWYTEARAMVDALPKAGEPS